MLTTENLSYWYTVEEDYLFKDVNLQFTAGHSYAIVGQSGSGKTTMVSLLAGLDTPKAGKILIEGVDIRKIGLTQYRQSKVSIVFQAYNLFTYMSALENLMTAMAITKAEHRGDREFAKGMLRKLGLTDQQMTQNVQRLSGGQQQRVAIARTMVCDAPLVVADEPTGNLDEGNTDEVIALFNQIAHEQQKCVIIVTHEPTVAAQCDGVLRLAKREFTWEKQPALATQPA
ncbi:MAG: ABC transporter ATP-binding protein [Lactobacillus sp.]|jgi:putative ABC transport system ATP-binding protein|uniref:ABC transporter ATP-binding protein n=1 Tax=Lacticaseibacillus suilingensis TaxID=2799577 RepID=A0ABW4BEJ0_9LACO|nr:ABC transporter ATP-binding protein [Lacticaseibacillus suilingensis]MCI1893154.1 ABC transporter ATP-binding protein [Lactobacillus sp.]MCI1917363.1 ABC transporter ATP-binding protein [Lactobacillus sp.]MCI1940896.1 ABC transporter ATP-binding protein [Lactobacillus sp.]MCI1971275.1 ABC transporter ATP-binding protein [Lactobacillus sp.]MCI2016986.1 ABC transporter ATP-binding protein [Lactobacillus sp.]